MMCVNASRYLSHAEHNSLHFANLNFLCHCCPVSKASLKWFPWPSAAICAISRFGDYSVDIYFGGFYCQSFHDKNYTFMIETEYFYSVFFFLSLNNFLTHKSISSSLCDLFLAATLLNYFTKILSPNRLSKLACLHSYFIIFACSRNKVLCSQSTWQNSG